MKLSLRTFAIILARAIGLQLSSPLMSEIALNFDILK